MIDSVGIATDLSRQALTFRLITDSVGIATDLSRQVLTFRLIIYALALGGDLVTVSIAGAGVITGPYCAHDQQYYVRGSADSQIYVRGSADSEAQCQD